MITFLKNILRALLKAESVPQDGPLNIKEFNARFVSANKALQAGDTDALKVGISLFMESLVFAGPYAMDMRSAIKELYRALSHHDRADLKGPFNRDLSGYGVHHWWYDLRTRDEALRRAWPYINSINQELRRLGLGWRY